MRDTLMSGGGQLKLAEDAHYREQPRHALCRWGATSSVGALGSAQGFGWDTCDCLG